jgi:hypothetical protein
VVQQLCRALDLLGGGGADCGLPEVFDRPGSTANAGPRGFGRIQVFAPLPPWGARNLHAFPGIFE